jgi:hypothetical protein
MATYVGETLLVKKFAAVLLLLLEHDEIRLVCNRNGSALPLPLGEGWGEGLRSLVVTPSPDLLRKSTSPRRGEVMCPLTDRFNPKPSRFRHSVDCRRSKRAIFADCRVRNSFFARWCFTPRA